MSSSDAYVPYLRRRNTPAQRDALDQLFDANPHPTRAQRQALANEIGLELKSVTNWFQNRRQTNRKKSLSSENPRQTRSKTPLDRSKVSLDHIATLSERPGDASRSPLTPRKANVQPSSDLWTRMLSSPVSPSEPDSEEARMIAWSSRTRSVYPLEWACLKARQKKWPDDDVTGGPAHRRRRRQETALDEPRTPFPCPDSAHFRDVEAAITLLDFKTRA